MKEIIDIGDTVICDICNEDYTNRDDSGGFLFGTYAYCPDCAKSRMANIRSYNEEKYIKAHCPPNMSYKDWVLQLRGGDNRIIISNER